METIYICYDKSCGLWLELTKEEYKKNLQIRPKEIKLKAIDDPELFMPLLMP